jgi:hypothetical protein
MLKPAHLGPFCGLVLLVAVSGAEAQARPTVVELYTSEGCSSCPPAEAQIGKLAHQDGIIALAFHVDYWDSLGWHDRFDFPEATARQRQYAHTLKLATVYTPQLVVDGQRDVVGGGDGIGVTSGKTAGVPIAISLQNDAVVVSLDALQSASSCDVILVGYLPEAVSKVTRGENAGRELREFNIVRSIRKLGSWQGAGESFSVPLTTLPGDATAVAVLVQQHDQGPIIGAASRPVR